MAALIELGENESNQEQCANAQMLNKMIDKAKVRYDEYQKSRLAIQHAIMKKMSSEATKSGNGMAINSNFVKETE